MNNSRVKKLIIFIISFVALFSAFSSPTTASILANEYSLNSLNAPSAGKDNVRFVISSESNAWAPSSEINPYTSVKAFNAFLKPCEEANIEVCIESVESRFGSGNWYSAHVLPDAGHQIAEMPTIDQSGNPVSYKYSTFDGDLTKFLPPGGNPRLWKSDDSNLTGAFLRVIADVHGFQGKESSGLALQVKAVTNKQDSQGCNSVGGKWNTYTEGKPSSGFCDLTLKIPSDLEFRIKLKFKGFEDPIKGWFTSTILNPSVDFTNGVLTITGGPTAHANFVSDPVPFTEYCQIYTSQNPQYPCPYNGKYSFPNGTQSLLSREWGQSAMPFAKYFQQQSLGEQNLWLFESTFQTPFNTMFHNQIFGCKLNKPIFGVISTDAALYTIADLKWNSLDKSFEYSVYSPHLNSSGATNKGFFSLLVDRAVANCLWNTNLTSAKAVLSVNYEDGTSEVATSILGKDDNWVSFQNSGFHYSKPRFLAKLDLTEKPKEPITATEKPNQISKSTLVCVKGKIIRKVSGVNPKCPAGFKKKI